MSPQRSLLTTLVKYRGLAWDLPMRGLMFFGKKGILVFVRLFCANAPGKGFFFFLVLLKRSQ